MSKTHLLLKILIPFLIIHGQINAQQPTRISKSIPEAVEVIKDIQYVKYKDRKLLLDIYRPTIWGEGQLRTILVIRGGGWANGDKEAYGYIATALALRGFAAVCIEYRTSDEAIFPAAVLDSKLAIKWIKHNANKYNFNHSGIGAIGGSAGGHLAALVGVSSKANLLNPTEVTNDFTIQAVVGLSTHTDFRELSENKAIIKWLGKPYPANEELWESASPISYIDKDSPPMLLIHSSSDNLVPYEQSLLAIEKLGKVGVYSELVLIPNAPHNFYNFEEWFGFTMDKTASFFKEQLKN